MSRLSLCALVLLAPLLYADKVEPTDPKAPKPRELKLKETRPKARPRGPARPVKVTTAKELKNLVVNADEILKQVNLKKEYLVVFSWAGSGRDRISLSTKDGKGAPKVTFVYKRGLTRDLRMHFKVFALPAKATYEMGK